MTRRAGVRLAVPLCALLISGCTAGAPTPKPSASASASASPPNTAHTLTILGAGDELLHPQIWAQAAKDAKAHGRAGLYFDDIFASVKPDITAASLAVCHLETPLAPAGGPYRGYPRFSVPPQIAHHHPRHRLRHVLDRLEPHARSGAGRRQTDAGRPRRGRRPPRWQLSQRCRRRRAEHPHRDTDRRRPTGEDRATVLHVRIQRADAARGRDVAGQRDATRRRSCGPRTPPERPARRSWCCRSTGASSIHTRRTPVRPHSRNSCSTRRTST